MDLVKRSSPYFSRFSAQGMVLVNPFLRFTKTTDFISKIPGLRARVPERLQTQENGNGNENSTVKSAHKIPFPPGI